ncbi:hypothetical protein LPTSP4_18210 [Leptospira ryugenii]|uniref:Uncharacterized protein n=1 Tax=Leptospira ryugenii TaxID=1917863 RepID=A0A2P2E0F7_9LEPT|nr:hypothetical protein [Leptospira ryugenii]GBF50296.1 hypothetical protein LPTSP4_18210 [Leptospira ryugenii]
MKQKLKRFYKMAVFMSVLRFFGPLSRLKVLSIFVRAYMHMTARFVSWVWSAQEKRTVEEIASEWTNQMPKPHSMFPITKIENGIAHGEIKVHCPLRGTGDPMACYRLMQYDRSLVEALGGELIVLESQSNSGENFCKVAIKKKGTSWKELKTAWPVSMEDL